MKKAFGGIFKLAPKYILLLALLLVLTLVMSLLCPELRPELIEVKPGGIESSSEHEGTGQERGSEENPDVGSVSEAPFVQRFPVYLTGAVAKPGIYYMVGGDILADAVHAAGGLTSDAAADYINLAKALKAHEMLRIPYLGEVENGRVPPLYNEDEESPSGDAALGLVNINEADEATLCTLPGVGSATAKSIIAWREEQGPFMAIEDIMKVPGIKEARFNQLKELISI